MITRHLFSLPSLRLALLGALLPLVNIAAPQNAAPIHGHLDANRANYEAIAHQIWSWAEVGYQETRSSGLLQQALGDAGFTVTPGVADIPTAFIASYGSGGPVIAILAEFDALPGVSQDAVTSPQPLEQGAAGHACGHHLFGTGSVAAAIAVRDWLNATGRPGTIRVYGTPAEEGGSGKVYMVRAGLFDDVDAVLHWHAADRNSVWMSSSLANKSAKFRFHGIASHAAAAPENGRSALDGVEAMNHMVNLMREHVPSEARIHYVITRGGEAPNVVPAFAEVFYYVRHPDRANAQAIWERVEDAARGAALGTGTTVDWEIIHGNYELLPNEALGRAMQANFDAVGGVVYDDAETQFAHELGRTFITGRPLSLDLASSVQPFNPNAPTMSGSTDVGDVSWAVPTMGLRAATWVPGTSAHSWQAVACGGMSIGHKGMHVAAKTLALTAADLFEQPDVLAAAKAEWQRRRGEDFHYVPLLGDRAPPLDYRN